MVINNIVIHAIADHKRMRAPVTNFVYLNECFMAKYHSTFIKTRWSTVDPPNIRSAFLEIRCSVQNSLDSRAVNILDAVKKGSPITPIKPSVAAKHTSAMLDMVFSRGFVLTATTTSAFKTAVMGEMIMPATIKNITDGVRRYAAFIQYPSKKNVDWTLRCSRIAFWSRARIHIHSTSSELLFSCVYCPETTSIV